ncbi:MAG: signal peptidase II [Patescibacteria group bacterium]
MNFLSTKIFRNSVIFVVLIFIDQLSKYLIRLKGGFYICNPNIFWGIKIPNDIFYAFWGLIIAVLLMLLFKKSLIYNSIFIILIIAGAASNMIDRLLCGCVVDFINLKLWPVFNLADVFIVCGALFLLVRQRKI